MPDPLTFMYIKPDYDEPSIKYLILTEPVRDYAQQKGYQVIDLEGEFATPNIIFNAIQEYDPYIVYSCGHGCTHMTTAQDYTNLFWVNPGCSEQPVYDNNLNILANRITVLLSCYCGANLLPAIINNGGIAASGYYDEFTWVVNTDLEPKEDPFALTFFDPPNYLMSLILDGMPISEAHKKTKERYNLMISTWETWVKNNSNGSAVDLARAYLTLSLLEHDRNVMTSIGEGLVLSEQSALSPITLLVGVVLGGAALNYMIQSQKHSH